MLVFFGVYMNFDRAIIALSGNKYSANIEMKNRAR